MVLHGPSLHFHLGAWAVAAIATFVAFWLTFILQSGFLGEEIYPKEKVNKYVDQLDFVAHVTGIVGFIGIVAAGITGLMDATHEENSVILGDPLKAIIDGYELSAQDEILAFKVIWTIVGAYCFLFAGIMRLYFVNFRHERIYDQHSTVQVLYAEAIMLGYLIMVVVAAAGGMWTYGETILEDMPILEGFLPGRGGYLMFVTILGVMLSAMLVMSSLLVREPARTSPQVPKE